MLKKFLIVKTTFKNKEEAEFMANILLKNKLIACAQISIVESIFTWEENIKSQTEFLLTLKTTKKLYKIVEETIHKNHKYKVPQIIALPIYKGLKDYFKWIESSVRNY